MHSPLVSVIVPVYNTASYLRRCLDSLCGQSYRNLQIICVDDGSTDESPAILAEYAERDARITVITQHNAGQGTARNAGMRIANGEWLTGLDSDDFLDVDAYEKLVAYTYLPEVDVICFDCVVEGEESVRDIEYSHLKYSGCQRVNPQLLLTTNCYFVTKLWRRSFVENVQGEFAEGLHYEDAYFYYTVFSHARLVYYCGAALYHYWQRADSTMHQASPRGAEHLDIVQLILQQYQAGSFPSTCGSFRPSRFELDLLVTYTILAIEYTPPDKHHRLLERAYSIATMMGIQQAYPIETAWLRKRSCWGELFIKARPGKLSYRFFGIPLLSFQIKQHAKITRFLGIKIQHQGL